eukprot:COSAG06_NODE_69843_length_195_cov_60.395833_1_plen_28_part_10
MKMHKRRLSRRRSFSKLRRRTDVQNVPG